MAAAPGSGRYRALRMAALALAGCVAIFVEIAPIGFTTEARPSPDFLFCVVACWVVRRPGASPVLLIFALGLARDLLADLPVGAGALTLMLAAEFLRTQGPILARQPFLAEWATVAMVALAMISAQFLLVVLTLAQPPYVMDLLWQGLYTAAVYPAVALLARWVFGIGWAKGGQRRGTLPGASLGRRA